jgi:hypothetical protein
VRKRRLAIICRISRCYPAQAVSLMNDLGFKEILQSLKAENGFGFPLTTEEVSIINELLYYLR